MAFDRRKGEGDRLAKTPLPDRVGVTGHGSDGLNAIWL